MKCSVVIPSYDDRKETAAMAEAVRRSLLEPVELEFVSVDLRERSANLPAAKNEAVGSSTSEFVLFLYPGIFPANGSIEKLLSHFRERKEVSAVSGRWSNAKGKVEIGYNVRRFPTFTALIFDILLINKFLPRNRFTRSYKMHDFDHNAAVFVEHANDCVFMVRRDAALRHRGFNEEYAPGWFDQVEFCQELNRAGERILFEPKADFFSNESLPVIDRLVRDNYAQYRRAECAYIRNHFGTYAGLFARLCIAIGMLERIVFSISLPGAARKWLLSTLRSYVNDEYIRDLRGAYWSVLKESLLGSI